MTANPQAGQAERKHNKTDWGCIANLAAAVARDVHGRLCAYGNAPGQQSHSIACMDARLVADTLRRLAPGSPAPARAPEKCERWGCDNDATQGAVCGSHPPPCEGCAKGWGYSNLIKMHRAPGSPDADTWVPCTAIEEPTTPSAWQPRPRDGDSGVDQQESPEPGSGTGAKIDVREKGEPYCSASRETLRHRHTQSCTTDGCPGPLLAEARDTIAALRRDLDSLRADNAQLRGEVEGHRAGAEWLKREAERLRAERDELSGTHALFLRNLGSSMFDSPSLFTEEEIVSDVKALRTERDELARKVDETEKLAAGSERRCATAEVRVAELEQKLKDAESVIRQTPSMAAMERVAELESALRSIDLSAEEGRKLTAQQAYALVVDRARAALSGKKGGDGR